MDFLRRLEARPALDEDNRLSFQLDYGSRVVSLPGTGETVRGFSAPDLIIEDSEYQSKTTRVIPVVVLTRS